MREALLVRSGRLAYGPAWELQRRLAAARREDRIPDVVWLLEHPPVYTVGRHGGRQDLYVSDERLAELGAEFHRVDRGGLMTWHGPGQTTGYVVADLRPGNRVRRFVDALLGAMEDAARAADLEDARADAAAVGLYRAGRKLGSVGIRVSRGITWHGFALNRDPDPSWFSLMTACGAPGVPTTSLALEGGDPDRGAVEAALASGLATRLDRLLVPAVLEDVMKMADRPAQGRRASHAATTPAISASLGSAPAAATHPARSSGSASSGSTSG